MASLLESRAAPAPSEGRDSIHMAVNARPLPLDLMVSAANPEDRLSSDNDIVTERCHGDATLGLKEKLVSDEGDTDNDVEENEENFSPSQQEVGGRWPGLSISTQMSPRPLFRSEEQQSQPLPRRALDEERQPGPFDPFSSQQSQQEHRHPQAPIKRPQIITSNSTTWRPYSLSSEDSSPILSSLPPLAQPTSSHPVSSSTHTKPRFPSPSGLFEPKTDRTDNHHLPPNHSTTSSSFLTSTKAAPPKGLHPTLRRLPSAPSSFQGTCGCWTPLNRLFRRAYKTQQLQQQQQEQQQTQQFHQQSRPAKASNLPPLSIRENDSDSIIQEHLARQQGHNNNNNNNNNSPSITSTRYPKMMKIIDKITKKVHHHEDEQASSHQQQTLNVKTKPAKDEGPRVHPDLLELYEVTDKVLGVGTFATVKEIKLRSTGKSYALKIILRKSLQGKGQMLDTEISVLSKVRHPNCVSLLEMFETEDAVYLVTDLAAGGELFDRLLKKGSYRECDAARLIYEILCGVEYLHDLDIVHRDLKPENLLFRDTSEGSQLMITDFGLSKMLTAGNDVLMTACGTPGYVAPEVLQQIGHSKPVDMWSVGVISYTLLCGYTPFWGEDQPSLFDSILSGEYEYEDEYWRHISPLAKNFIDSLLVKDAEARPTATQALNHPWFRSMLEPDMVTPTSPTDSVDLLPHFAKNFSARNTFQKVVRRVRMVQMMQSMTAVAVQQHNQAAAAVAGGESSNSDDNLDETNAKLEALEIKDAN